MGFWKIKLKFNMKRLLDIFGSLILILILSPIYFITAILIFIESGFPVIYRQKRASHLNGKSFILYKFRSMKNDNKFELAELEKLNEADGLLFKIKNDPRITNIGKIIRKFYIDELPQLINVLKGDMGLVGPRPLSLRDLKNIFLSNYNISLINFRSNIKPGITGYWQISKDREYNFEQMILLDSVYNKKNKSRFDFEILLKTISVVLAGKGI